jgi:exonuclease VII large subunit
MDDEKKSLTVSQVNRAIGAALEQSFSDAFWVVGEVQGYDRDAAKAGQRRWGQIYFELIEKRRDRTRSRRASRPWCGATFTTP